MLSVGRLDIGGIAHSRGAGSTSKILAAAVLGVLLIGVLFADYQLFLKNREALEPRLPIASHTIEIADAEYIRAGENTWAIRVFVRNKTGRARVKYRLMITASDHTGKVTTQWADRYFLGEPGAVRQTSLLFYADIGPDYQWHLSIPAVWVID
jgi:hypothetical protein